MRSTEISSEATAAAARALSGKGPVSMVNLIRYREQALYDGAAYTPCSGREAFFQRYVPAFGAIATKIAPGSFKLTFYGAVHAALVAPAGESWDNVAIAEYSSFDALRSIIESREFIEVATPHRLAALEDWRFIAVTKVEVQSP